MQSHRRGPAPQHEQVDVAGRGGSHRPHGSSQSFSFSEVTASWDSAAAAACVDWLRSLNVLCVAGLAAVMRTVVDRRMNLLNLRNGTASESAVQCALAAWAPSLRSNALDCQEHGDIILPWAQLARMTEAQSAEQGAAGCSPARLRRAGCCGSHWHHHPRRLRRQTCSLRRRRRTSGAPLRQDRASSASGAEAREPAAAPPGATSAGCWH